MHTYPTARLGKERCIQFPVSDTFINCSFPIYIFPSPKGMPLLRLCQEQAELTEWTAGGRCFWKGMNMRD